MFDDEFIPIYSDNDKPLNENPQEISLDNYGTVSYKHVNCISITSKELNINNKVCCNELNVLNSGVINGNMTICGDVNIVGNIVGNAVANAISNVVASEVADVVAGEVGKLYKSLESKDVNIAEGHCLKFGSDWRMSVIDGKMVIQKLNTETNLWNTKTTIN